ncbi:MAG TPA: hypothetical protein PLN05_12195 [Pyrinomonadaceae bacterium]|nr:hypothetical protein [Pyrinomonadaceae bacterium]HRK51182.1 hypothetical protein [Pyrinomonadaceae bacterium]
MNLAKNGVLIETIAFLGHRTEIEKMEQDFDKVIDALLRSSPEKKGVLVGDRPSAHLSADEISLFVENALPKDVRQGQLIHFAECDRCRAVLANAIRLSDDQAFEAGSPTVDARPVIDAPWYRRLFAMPNLAYAMGGLVLLFSGFIGYTLIQNTGSDTAMLSDQAESRAAEPAPAAADEPYVFMDSAANAATNTSSAAANSAIVPGSPFVPNGNDARTASASNSAATLDVARSRDEADLMMAKPAAAAPADAGPTGLNKAEAESKVNAKREMNELPTVARQTQESLPPPPPPAKSLPVPKDDAAGERSKASDAAKMKSVGRLSTDTARRQISGKTFERRDGTWYDSAYTGQPLTDVRRGTDDYRKLDSGLRRTADDLGGTVVIVWKAKAYRIQ